MFEKRAKKRLTFTILLGLVCVMLFIACTCIISDAAPQTVSAATTLTADEKAASIALHDGIIGGNYTHTDAWKLSSKNLGGGQRYVPNDMDIEETLIVGSGMFVNLCLNGHTLTMKGVGPMFRIMEGGFMSLCDCMGGGRMITGSDVCVVVEGKNSERNSAFRMDGGVICDSNNGSAHGGAVRVAADGVFNMRGGVIKNNKAHRGGGVYVAGTMVMDGGIITNNEAARKGDVAAQGCGIMCASGGSLTINGGIIRNNTTAFGDGGGIFCETGSDVAVKGGVIEKNSVVPNGNAGNGGGIFCHSGSNVSLTGGTISRNDTGGNGGGVFLNGSTLKIGGNVIIRDNISRGLGKNNLHLYLSAKIDFVSQILSGFDVGVSVQAIGIITSGYKTVGKLDPYSDLRLKIDSSAYVLRPAANGNEITALTANSWVIPLVMSNFVYGSYEVPSALAKYGKVEFSYSDSENGNFVSDMPTNLGVYWVKATVPAGDNYGDLSAVVSFEIKPIVLTEEMVGHIGGLFMYNGSRYVPPVSVIDKLLTNKDFVVTYGENIDAGEGTVTVTGKNNYSGTITRYFTIDPVTMTASVNGYMGTYDKTAHDAAAEQTAVTVNDQTATWTYSTDNDTYSETMPQFENAGTYTVYYKVNAPNHMEYSGTFTVEISKATVNTPTIGDKAYTGEAQTADVPACELYEVTHNDGGTSVGEYDVILTLTDHANYKWAENLAISGENSDTVTQRFAIVAKALTEEIVGNIEGTFTYTGAQYTPTVTVTDGSFLTADDYDISYGENINAGEGTVTVTGKGNYSGAITKKFTIDPATMIVSVRGYSGTYDKSSNYSVVEQETVTVNNQTATWTYSDTSDGTYTETMPQYINAGTYTVYYKVNAPNHNEYSGSFTVEIAKATVVAPAIAQKTYNGEPQTANVDETEEYAVTSNDGGTSAGEYDVILTLKDYANYKWRQDVDISGENAETVTLKFEITAKALTEAMVGNVEGTFIYTGAQHTPTITVEDGSLLTADDYDISYGMNVNAGTGTVTVTAKGNYNGAITRNFTIDRATMTVIVRAYSGTYDKTAHNAVAAKQAFTVNNETASWSYSKKSDGTYSYYIPQYTNVGTYTLYYKVYAFNHNDYFGSFTVEIAKATVVAPAIVEKTYNGEPQTADVVETEEYAVTINDGGTSAGEYDVILTLKDYANYKWLQDVDISGENAETATLKFTIAQAANDWTEAPQAGSVIYGVDVTATAQSAYGNVQITYVNEAGETYDLDPKLAGKYKAVFTVEGTADYTGLREEVSFTIGQREITITIHDKTSVYGEEPVPLTFELTEGEYAEQIDSDYIELRKEAGGDAKTYAITGECTNANYKVKFVNGKYKISKATYVTDNWSFDGKTVTYNGETHSLEVTGLPEGLTVTYVNNDKTNVGTYVVTAKFEADGNHNAVEDMTATLTIEKATYITDNWKFEGKTVTYNGGTHSLEITGLPAGLTVTYLNNGKMNVGTYVVTAKFEADGNHYAVDDMTATLTIEKATYITHDWTFDGKTVTYNGETHSLAVTGLPEGLTVTYINNGKTNTGTYEVTAKFSVDENHNAVEDMTATLTINKADHDMSGVTFEGKTVTYNGQTHSLAVTGLPEGVEVTYVNNNKTNAGTYTVTAKFVASANYNELADMTATLTVKKAVYNMSGVKLEDKTIVADGNTQSITVSGTLPDGVTVTYEGNGQTDAGEYSVTAKFSGDAANYEPIPDKTAKLTITQAPAKGGCGGVVLDGMTIAGITLAVLAFAVVFAMRKAKGRK